MIYRLVPEDVCQALLRYLATRPYQEVADGIRLLSQAEPMEKPNGMGDQQGVSGRSDRRPVQTLQPGSDS